MKKTIVCIVCSAMILSLSGCRKKNGETVANSDSAVSDKSATAETNTNSHEDFEVPDIDRDEIEKIKSENIDAYEAMRGMRGR